MTTHPDIEAFERFLKIRREIIHKSTSDSILRHEAFESEKSVVDPIFTIMADDFTRELINGVNRLYIDTVDADAWYRVAEPLPKLDKASLLYQYCEPHLELAVNRPYALRNRFAFAATHLLHQSNKKLQPEWKDELPKDRDIKITTLDKVADGWKRFAEFKALLDCLNDRDFVDSTQNYRNLSHHQIEINFDCGLVPIFRRRKTDTGVAYDYIVIRPLNVPNLIKLLQTQHEIAAKTFSAFWSLLEEQKAVWLK